MPASASESKVQHELVLTRLIDVPRAKLVSLLDRAGAYRPMVHAAAMEDHRAGAGTPLERRGLRRAREDGLSRGLGITTDQLAALAATL